MGDKLNNRVINPTDSDDLPQECVATKATKDLHAGNNDVMSPTESVGWNLVRSRRLISRVSE